jgi:hypothetical protein
VSAQGARRGLLRFSQELYNALRQEAGRVDEQAAQVSLCWLRRCFCLSAVWIVQMAAIVGFWAIRVGWVVCQALAVLGLSAALGVLTYGMLYLLTVPTVVHTFPLVFQYPHESGLSALRQSSFLPEDLPPSASIRYKRLSAGVSWIAGAIPASSIPESLPATPLPVLHAAAMDSPDGEVFLVSPDGEAFIQAPAHSAESSTSSLALTDPDPTVIPVPIAVSSSLPESTAFRDEPDPTLSSSTKKQRPAPTAVSSSLSESTAFRDEPDPTLSSSTKKQRPAPTAVSSSLPEPDLDVDPSDGHVDQLTMRNVWSALVVAVRWISSALGTVYGFLTLPLQWAWVLVKVLFQFVLSILSFIGGGVQSVFTPPAQPAPTPTPFPAHVVSSLDVASLASALSPPGSPVAVTRVRSMRSEPWDATEAMASSAPADGPGFLQRGQPYNVFFSLTIPTSAPMGGMAEPLFGASSLHMAQLELLGPRAEILARCSRPFTVTHHHWTLQSALEIVRFFVPFSSFWFPSTTVVERLCIDRYVDPPEAPLTTVRASVSEREVNIEHGTVRFEAQLEGLTFWMHHFFVASALIGIAYLTSIYACCLGSATVALNLAVMDMQDGAPRAFHIRPVA